MSARAEDPTNSRIHVPWLLQDSKFVLCEVTEFMVIYYSITENKTHQVGWELCATVNMADTEDLVTF